MDFLPPTITELAHTKKKERYLGGTAITSAKPTYRTNLQSSWGDPLDYQRADARLPQASAPEHHRTLIPTALRIERINYNAPAPTGWIRPIQCAQAGATPGEGVYRGRKKRRRPFNEFAPASQDRTYEKPSTPNGSPWPAKRPPAFENLTN